MEDYLSKIKDVEEMLAERDRLKAEGKVLVAAGGCYDLLHPGHLQTLSYARKLGDALLVMLNSDVSVRMLKGETRPVIPQQSRAQMLAALLFVDYVMLFDDISPANTLRLIKPDCFCKGEDYHPQFGDKALPEDEVDAINEYGGRIEFIPLVPDNSTTKIISSILSSYGQCDKT